MAGLADNAAANIESYELEQMLSSFRVHELQQFLSFAQASKLGRKHELLGRAVEVLRRRPFNMSYSNTIREIYRRRTGTSAPFTGNNRLPSMTSLAGPASSNRPITSHRSYFSGSTQMHTASHNPLATAFANAQPRQSTPAVREPVKGRPDQMRMVTLPFYDQFDTLLQPTELLVTTPQHKFQESYMTFSIPPKFVNVLNYNSDREQLPRHELQMRFFLLDISGEQKDDFPPNVMVRIDDQLVQLPNLIPTNKPGVEPKRPSRPVNVTQYCQPPRDRRPYKLHVTWQPDKRSWVVCLYVVRRVTSELLLCRLKAKGSRPPAFTRDMINNKLSLDTDDEISTDSMRVSLICPLGKQRIKIPGKPKECRHLQCFDVSLYLMMNEKRPTWICPVCDKPATFESLIIEGYFEDVLNEIDDDVREIEVFKGGSWRGVREDEDEDDEEQQQQQDNQPVRAPIKNEALTDSNKNTAPKTSTPASNNEEPECIDLTEDDDDASPAPVDRGEKRPLSTGGGSSVANSSSPPQSEGNSSNASPSLVILDSPPSWPGVSADQQPPRKRYARDTSASSISSPAAPPAKPRSGPPPLPQILNDPVPSTSAANNMLGMDWPTVQDPFWGAQLNGALQQHNFLQDYNRQAAAMYPAFENQVTANLQDFYAQCGFDPSLFQQ